MKYFILIVLVILASCADISSSVTTPKYIVRSEISIEEPGVPIHLVTGEYGVSIDIGEWITYVDDVDKFVIAYPADYPKISPSSMGGMSIERDVTSCSPQAIGISSPIDLTDSNGENAVWGEMDYYKRFWTLDFPIEFTDVCGYQKDQTIYAFCSEKDDKRVVICISQQTDDHKQAEKIFKTFRWTE